MLRRLIHPFNHVDAMTDTPRFDLPPELEQLLQQLRGRIRKYVFLEGIALTLAALAGLFWLSLALDHAWFAVSRLELPIWFRATFDVVVLSLMTLLIVSWIGLRVFRAFRLKALALVLERRFPQLDDRLVTAVELAAGKADGNSALSRAMMQKTIGDVAREASQLNLDDVFNPQPLRRALTGAVVLFASIGGLALVNSTALATWKDSFWDLDAQYWQRQFALNVKVIAQPGDLVREFRDGKYKHPRGADLALLIEVPEGKLVPETVQLKYRLSEGRGGGTVLCSKVGERQFRHAIAGLLDDVEFWIYGGDFVSRQPYQVDVVDAPHLDRIELASFYPDYTGMLNPESKPERPLRTIVPVRGTQVALPVETEFFLQAQSNKPLKQVRVQMASRELVLDVTESRTTAKVIERNEETQKADVVEIGVTDWVNSSRQELSVPLLVSGLLTDSSKARFTSLKEKHGTLVVPPDTQLRIYLEDTDEILTPEPARVLISGIVDQPPVVETKLRGIGTSITRKASIPILGRIADDYGLADVRFEFQINDAPEWTRRTLEAGLPTDTVSRREFKLQRKSDEEYERFDVVALDLSLGQKLVVSVAAEDKDNLNGPHITRGERYTFKVVTNEELLSVLYQRELNLRRRFEQIIEESKGTQRDLIRHRARVDDRSKLVSSGTMDDESKQKLTTLNNAIIACAEQSLHAVRKNANETASLELGFRDIREELVNNGLHTPQTLERLDDRIVKPLHAINAQDYPLVDEALGLYRLANNKSQDPTPAIDASVQALGVLIANMERILGEMRKLETFQEALEQLKAIIEQQEQLTDKTKKEQKKKLLEGLQ